MNKSPKDHSGSSSSSLNRIKLIGSYACSAAMFVCLLLLWRGQERIQAGSDALAEENDTLRQELADTKAELKSTRTKLDFFTTGDASKPKEKASAKKPVVRPEPEPEPETLALRPPAVLELGGNLTARLSFESKVMELPDLVALVVRIPGSSSAIIIDLAPVDAASFTNVKSRIDGSGKFAIFQGSPADLKAMDFNLTVSGPVKATVRGSKGITPFEIDIAPGNPAVRNIE